MMLLLIILFLFNLPIHAMEKSAHFRNSQVSKVKSSGELSSFKQGESKLKNGSHSAKYDRNRRKKRDELERKSSASMTIISSSPKDDDRSKTSESEVGSGSPRKSFLDRLRPGSPKKIAKSFSARNLKREEEDTESTFSSEVKKSGSGIKTVLRPAAGTEEIDELDVLLRLHMQHFLQDLIKSKIGDRFNQDLIKEVTRAYAEGDLSRLNEILYGSKFRVYQNDVGLIQNAIELHYLEQRNKLILCFVGLLNGQEEFNSTAKRFILDRKGAFVFGKKHS